VNHEIRGLCLNVEKRGAGEPAIVFLHYWGGTSRTWSKVVAELQGRFTTVAYDARGWGRSDKTPASYKLTDLADGALSLIEQLGIKTYVLVGHSLGGKVSQLIASRVLQAIKLLSARTPLPDIVEQIVEDSMSGSREATLAYPTASILEDISSEISKISVPTLVLAGELDQVDSIDQHKHEVVARNPNARFAIIKGSGHLIPIDEPVQLANAIGQFVAALR
jgi:pimeloyl-ACP methyl ester carboxylesterase